MGILFLRRPIPAPIPASVTQVQEWRGKRECDEADKRAKNMNVLREQLANVEGQYMAAQQRLVEMMGNPRTTPAALTAQQNSVDQLDGQVSQLDALLQQTLYVGDTLQPQYFHS